MTQRLSLGFGFTSSLFLLGPIVLLAGIPEIKSIFITVIVLRIAVRYRCAFAVHKSIATGRYFFDHSSL